MFPTGRQHRFNVNTTFLDVMDKGSMPEQHWIPAGLKFEEQGFRVKRTIELSMTYWLQRLEKTILFQKQIEKLDFV